MQNIFTEHPNSIGETYLQHMRFALTFGGKMILGGLACVIHGIFPFIFKKTGSNVLLNMAQYYVSRMPFVEDRVIHLSTTIQQKVSQADEVATDSPVISTVGEGG